MRLVIDFRGGGNHGGKRVKPPINRNWGYAIATSVLVAAMVIPQVSQWVESQQLVKSLLGALHKPTQTNGDNKAVSTDRFVFPTVAGSPVTSEFGWRERSAAAKRRTHPITGRRSFHEGIDFGAPMGTPIYAADSGRVVRVGDRGEGYGNAVVIQHQGNISTLYAHASKLYVVEGQQVVRGQAIAAVGSTGFSTGPHLHFEVRVNGVERNPRPYLQKYLAKR
ncbi:peptidoglycan DD-metalloendopeptidase family protein [Scytonema sp. UIC 10036]|uniref:M23 family metallopeptidase n=1 Tax=Scytonema sp. UIC 10036 TaxID=2304196 RepID=UPI0012DAE095|nr:M23 family metallopeptidase [Scytonema sp. UIC 10036]MUG91753.1 peptidoglycan DD-metalloendopeptidase family protein [Scytonema sp. UIC 10036]